MCSFHEGHQQMLISWHARSEGGTKVQDTPAPRITHVQSHCCRALIGGARVAPPQVADQQVLASQEVERLSLRSSRHEQM